MFSLACLIKYYKKNEPSDSKAVLDYIKTHDVGEILSNADLWGADLSDMTDLINDSLAYIENNGVREAIRWSMS